METGRELSDQLQGRNCQLVVSPDNQWLLTTWEGDGAGKAVVWDLTGSGSPVRIASLNLTWDEHQAMNFSRDSQRLVTHDGDQARARLWDLADLHRDPLILQEHSGNGTCWQYVSQRWLLMWSYNNTIHVWDATSTDPAASKVTLCVPADDIAQATVSPNDRWLVVATGYVPEDNPTIWLYDISSSSKVGSPYRLPDHTDKISAIEFDSDCGRMVTASHDKTIRVWDLSAADLRASCLVLQDTHVPNWIELSQDGCWLLAAGRDSETRLWNLRLAEAQQRPITLSGYDEVGFAADSTRLICRKLGLEEAQPLRMDELVAAARCVAGRELTDEERDQFLTEPEATLK